MRIALVGTGDFALAHIGALRAAGGFEIAAVVGRNIEKTRQVALAAPGARATVDYESVLTDPSIDAVDVCNWTPGHARDAIAAGLAGKRVHVEKPAALNLTDLEEMLAATDGGKRLFIGQTVRFQPAPARLKRLIDDGEIGQPRLAHITWYTGHVWPGGWRGWQHKPEFSGGHPVHNGTHIMDAATWLLGSEPTRVMCRPRPTWAPEMPVPDGFVTTVEFANGALATLELCYLLKQRGAMLRRLLVAGTEGTLEHSTADDPGLLGPGEAPASVDGALTEQMRQWHAVLRGERQPPVSAAQARAVLAGAIASQKSLVSGQVQEVTR